VVADRLAKVDREKIPRSLDAAFAVHDVIDSGLIGAVGPVWFDAPA
jgi:hypothetical protein